MTSSSSFNSPSYTESDISVNPFQFVNANQMQMYPDDHPDPSVFDQHDSSTTDRISSSPDMVDDFFNNVAIDDVMPHMGNVLPGSDTEFVVSNFMRKARIGEDSDTSSPLATSSWPESSTHSETPPTPDGDPDRKLQTDCVCKECGKSFNSVWYLKQHAVKHSSERPFKCKFCHKTYRFRSNLYQHKCPDRDKHMGARSSSGRGPRSNAGSKRKNSTTSTSSSLSVSSFTGLNTGRSVGLASRVQKSTLKLSRTLPASFNSPTTVSAKLPMHISPNQGMGMMGDMEEGFCDPHMERESRLGPERKVHRQQEDLLNATQGSFDDKEIEEYLDRFRGRLHRCTKCRIWFPSREYLTRHMASHAFIDSRVKCLHCSQSFETEEEYATHKQRHAPQSPNICPVCKGNFRSRLALKRHLAQCSAISPMQAASPMYPLSFMDKSPPDLSGGIAAKALLAKVVERNETDSGIGASESPSGGSDSSLGGSPSGDGGTEHSRVFGSRELPFFTLPPLASSNRGNTYQPGGALSFTNPSHSPSFSGDWTDNVPDSYPSFSPQDDELGYSMVGDEESMTMVTRRFVSQHRLPMPSKMSTHLPMESEFVSQEDYWSQHSPLMTTDNVALKAVKQLRKSLYCSAAAISPLRPTSIRGKENAHRHHTWSPKPSCEKCKRVFTTQQRMKEHQRLFHGLDQQSYKSVNSFQKHPKIILQTVPEAQSHTVLNQCQPLKSVKLSATTQTAISQPARSHILPLAQHSNNIDGNSGGSMRKSVVSSAEKVRESEGGRLRKTNGRAGVDEERAEVVVDGGTTPLHEEEVVVDGGTTPFPEEVVVDGGTGTTPLPPTTYPIESQSTTDPRKGEEGAQDDQDVDPAVIMGVFIFQQNRFVTRPLCRKSQRSTSSNPKEKRKYNTKRKLQVRSDGVEGEGPSGSVYPQDQLTSQGFIQCPDCPKQFPVQKEVLSTHAAVFLPFLYLDSPALSPIRGPLDSLAIFPPQD